MKCLSRLLRSHGSRTGWMQTVGARAMGDEAQTLGTDRRLHLAMWNRPVRVPRNIPACRKRAATRHSGISLRVRWCHAIFRHRTTEAFAGASCHATFRHPLRKGSLVPRNIPASNDGSVRPCRGHATFRHRMLEAFAGATQHFGIECRERSLVPRNILVSNVGSVLPCHATFLHQFQKGSLVPRNIPSSAQSAKASF